MYGPVLGVAAGWILALIVKYCRRRRIMDQEFESLVALAAALLVYAAGEAVFPNSGLAAVIVSGLTVSNILGPAAEELRRVKGRISRFLISILFMLLASDFPIGSLRALWPGGFLAVLALMVLVRPLNALVSTYRSTLNWRERLFIACVGPRGIVAFSVASIFSMELRRRGHAVLADQLLGMTFLTVMITVLLSGVIVYPLAWVLRLTRRKPTGLLIVGANDLAQRVAGLYDLRGIPVLLMDTNSYHCTRARQAGYTVVEGSALDGELLALQDWAGIDSLLVMTPSVTVNARIAAYTARQLQMVMTYAADIGTLPEETKHLAQAGALRAFSQKVNINEICQILQQGRGALRSLSLPISAEKRPYFLPLVITDKNLVHPYSPDETYPDGSEVIGMEFEQPWPNIE
ncbi:MAG: potassium/proton antiporter [Planctomycetes bacterium ADurb.Bin412]|nr:MAG: potassium/proton antiporter [Planctomycetes bacterium ADurb.Bin412]